MALDKSKLKSEIVSLLEDMMTREQNSLDEFADRLSSAIDAYVKSAEIEYKGGLANNGGPVTGTFNGGVK